VNELGIYALIDDAALQASLDGLAAATGRTQGEVLRAGASTFARYLAGNTMPVIVSAANPENPDGGSLAARNMGRKAVARDLARVYISPAKIFSQLKNWSNAKLGASIARQFYKAIKSGNISEARSILRRSGISAQHLEIIDWDSGAHHRKSRNKYGRVQTSNKPVIVTDPKRIKEYVKAKQKLVGWAKSGWIAAGRQVNGKGTASAWMSQPAPATGKDNTKNTETPSVSLTNRVSYAHAALREKYNASAGAGFVRTLVKQTDAILAKQAAKEQARVNGKH